jgi:hypothetical protein
VQFCRLAGAGEVGTCSPFLSFEAIATWAENELETFFVTPKQIRTARSMIQPVISTDISTSIKELKSPLLADALAYDMISLPVPANQWITEAQNWFTISLANTQHRLVDYITGPPAQFTQFVPFNQAKNDTTLAWLCSNQIIRRNDFTNFSTLAISLIFGIGIVVILSAFWVESVTGLVRSKRRKGEWRQTAWWSEETLQLQMNAFFGMGITDWKSAAINQVPVTRKNEQWSSVREWEKILAQVEEGAKEGKKKPYLFTLPVLVSSDVTSSASCTGSSNTEGPKSPSRVRSYSV